MHGLPSSQPCETLHPVPPAARRSPALRRWQIAGGDDGALFGGATALSKREVRLFGVRYATWIVAPIDSKGPPKYGTKRNGESPPGGRYGGHRTPETAR